MRKKLIIIAFRKNKLHYLLPLTIIYGILPLISFSTIVTYGLEQSCRIVVFSAQALVPIFSLLFPMAILNIWIGNEGWETLQSCNRRHRSCSDEIVFLCLAFWVVILPFFLLFWSVYGFLWMEIVRLYAQCLLVMSAQYFCTVFTRNVTLGCIPITVYLFSCICLNDKEGYADFSILELYSLSDSLLMKKYISIYLVSLLLIVIGKIAESKRV